MIHLVPTSLVPSIWRLVCADIDRALEHAPDWMTGLMVYEALLAGHAQLVVIGSIRAPRAVMVLECKVYPGPVTVANVWTFAGEPGVWAEVGAEVERFLDAWSSSQGCDRITMQGRPGWQRLLGDEWDFLPVVHASRKVRSPGHDDSVAHDRRAVVSGGPGRSAWDG